MSEEPSRLDERTLRIHVARSAFQRHAGRLWDEPVIAWPYVYVWMTARMIAGQPDGYWVRLDCSNYPADPPTGTFWNRERDVQLANAQRPVLTGSVQLAFRTDWENGRAFYLACDRVAVQTHGPDWARAYSHQAWNAARDISFFLHEISSLLHSTNYAGTAGA